MGMRDRLTFTTLLGLWALAAGTLLFGLAIENGPTVVVAAVFLAGVVVSLTGDADT